MSRYVCTETVDEWTESTSCGRVSGNSWFCCQWLGIHEHNHHWWQIHVLGFMVGIESGIVRMEELDILEVKESVTIAQNNQGDVNSLLWLLRRIKNHEYSPSNQSMNKEYYLEVIRRLRVAVRCKRPTNGNLEHESWTRTTHWPSRLSLSRRLWPSNSITVVHQALYSQDMTLCDYWLFQRVKIPLKRTWFESRKKIIKNATVELEPIPHGAFKRCFQ